MPDNPTNNTSPPTTLTKAEFASRINRSVRSLERWDVEGVFKARRTPGGQPFYLPEDVDRFLGGVDPEDTISQKKSTQQA